MVPPMQSTAAARTAVVRDFASTRRARQEVPEGKGGTKTWRLGMLADNPPIRWSVRLSPAPRPANHTAKAQARASRVNSKSPSPVDAFARIAGPSREGYDL